MPKHRYVVVDWGSWGVEAQSSSKIIVRDPFNVREGDECSLQGTDPATKRPMLFQGHVLAVFGDIGQVNRGCYRCKVSCGGTSKAAEPFRKYCAKERIHCSYKVICEKEPWPGSKEGQSK
ncbi:uncharacterized protein [Pocillopora verrucosa]|uniref:uncharacterized protein isoform X3 n=1 Tax=Pocillopora verrucosa TaxID=203993 RepID=UPI00333FE6A2